MKTVLAALAALAIAPVAVAGGNLVQNGGFESSSYAVSSQFGPGFGGEGVTDWNSPSAQGYNVLWFADNATTVYALNQWNDPGNLLPVAFTPLADGGNNFVGLDADPEFNGPLQQMVNGLTVGQKYNLTFDWAGVQLQNRTGPTFDQLQATLGGVTQDTRTIHEPTQGFSGWMQQDFVFTATSSSELLSFLAVGGPNGLPPMVLLDNVSLTTVPEPAAWMVMLLGLAGLGAAMRVRRGAGAAA
jgi:hypothetical protein